MTIEHGPSVRKLTERDRFIAALERRPIPGRVPHFELAFFLTMEVFGKVHPRHRSYHQWDQMSEDERRAHRRDIARLYVDCAERYDWSAIFLHPNPGTPEETQRLIDLVRDEVGDRYFLLMHGDATYAIPNGERMPEFCYRLADEPEAVHAEAARRVERRLEWAERLQGLDGLALCADYCFNDGPFLSPNQFSEFIAPYLKRLIEGLRQRGYYVVKHTDGDIMPILDMLLEGRPHALHSLDPQAGVDMATMVARVGDRVALCGNVDCGLLSTGTDEQVAASASYAIEHGLRAPGYVFCTSNCIYTGIAPERYDLILDLWRRRGVRE